jgi:hypothetical protein
VLLGKSCGDIAQKHHSPSFVITPAVVAGVNLLALHLLRRHSEEER